MDELHRRAVGNLAICRRGKPCGADLPSHLSCDRHHRLSAKPNTLEQAQDIAAHESLPTTKLYDRRSDDITLDVIERITS